MDITDHLDPNKPPPFMRLKEGASDANLAESWDAWSVESTGDKKKDYLLGVEYADIALRKVRVTNNPAALTMPLVAAILKLTGGDAQSGEIVKGFVDRLASLASDARERLDTN